MGCVLGIVRDVPVEAVDVPSLMSQNGTSLPSVRRTKQKERQGIYSVVECSADREEGQELHPAKIVRPMSVFVLRLCNPPGLG